MEQKNIPEIDRNTAKSLFELARAASDKAYAPFSHYKVGAALLTKGGKVYTGVISKIHLWSNDLRGADCFCQGYFRRRTKI